MEDSPKSSSKCKVIKVHRNNSNAASSSSSEWIGIRFSLPKTDEGASSGSNVSEKEQEIRVINLEQAVELPPVMLLYPDLKEEEMGCSIKGEISTMDLLRLLKGKKANKMLLGPSKKFVHTNSMPSVVEESPSTDLSCITEKESNQSFESSVISVDATTSDYFADESSVE